MADRKIPENTGRRILASLIVILWLFISFIRLTHHHDTVDLKEEHTSHKYEQQCKICDYLYQKSHHILLPFIPATNAVLWETEFNYGFILTIFKNTLVYSCTNKGPPCIQASSILFL